MHAQGLTLDEEGGRVGVNLPVFARGPGQVVGVEARVGGKAGPQLVQAGRLDVAEIRVLPAPPGVLVGENVIAEDAQKSHRHASQHAHPDEGVDQSLGSSGSRHAFLRRVGGDARGSRH